MEFTPIDFPLYFYSPLIENRGNFLAITVTPEMKSIPFSFYQLYDANYAITLRNKGNDQSRISLTAFKIKIQERYKHVIDISVDLIMPLIKNDYYKVIYLDIKDVGKNLMNTYRFDIFNETGSCSSFIDIFTVNNKPEYDFIYARPPVLEGLILSIKLFSTNKITFKVFNKLFYLTSAVASASIHLSDVCWKSTVKLLKKLLNQDEDTEEIIIKLKQNCCRDKEKLSPLLQSLILAVKDKEMHSTWKNLFKSFYLDGNCFKTVIRKIDIEILKGIVNVPDKGFGARFYYELSVVMLDVPNVSFRVDPFYFVMLND